MPPASPYNFIATIISLLLLSTVVDASAVTLFPTSVSVYCGIGNFNGNGGNIGGTVVVRGNASISNFNVGESLPTSPTGKHRNTKH